MLFQIRNNYIMAHSAPLIIRLVASSVRTARRAGDIIRNVMAQGDLRIVEKVL